MIGIPGVFVATSMGVTVPLMEFATYAVCPFGVMAMPAGPVPTLIGVPGVLVAVAR